MFNRNQKTLFFLDKEGRWYHEGVEITHPRTSLLFSKSLYKSPNGKYYIKIKHECSEVTIEDAPYIVRSVDFIAGTGAESAEFLLYLNDATREYLSPKTLAINAENVMYCLVKNQTERARFLRPAYYQLCNHISFDERISQYWLPWKGKKIYISQDLSE